MAGAVVPMHHRGLGDANGRPRAQESAARAHEGKQVLRAEPDGQAFVAVLCVCAYGRDRPPTAAVCV